MDKSDLYNYQINQYHLIMRKNLFAGVLCVLIFGITNMKANAQAVPLVQRALAPATPWTKTELIEPAALAAVLNNLQATAPLIYNIGAVEDIKDAKHIGTVSRPENFEKFKNAIAGLSKNAIIVIYCGCCPFTKCPNIRPAYQELKMEGFTNIRVLDLPTNLKSDWIAKGYPLASK
jgi:hypothetical protein